MYKVFPRNLYSMECHIYSNNMLPRGITVSLHTLLHVHSFNVIVSYLGLGQPPLQLRLITFNTQFICVYITSLVLLPSAARLRHFAKIYPWIK